VRLAPGPDEVGRAVRAAVVDDEDVDPVRQAGGAGRTLAGGLSPSAQVAEQLVEGRLDPAGLVEGGQDDRERRGRLHRG
jgi:hypothetical protein